MANINSLDNNLTYTLPLLSIKMLLRQTLANKNECDKPPHKNSGQDKVMTLFPVKISTSRQVPTKLFILFPEILEFELIVRQVVIVTASIKASIKPSIKAVTITTCLTMSHATRYSTHGRTDQEIFFGTIHLSAKTSKQM